MIELCRRRKAIEATRPTDHNYHKTGCCQTCSRFLTRAVGMCPGCTRVSVNKAWLGLESLAEINASPRTDLLSSVPE